MKKIGQQTLALNDSKARTMVLKKGNILMLVHDDGKMTKQMNKRSKRKNLIFFENFGNI